MPICKMGSALAISCPRWFQERWKRYPNESADGVVPGDIRDVHGKMFGRLGYTVAMS